MLYAITIFLSAFLLFQIQPFIAKMVLPLFGGGAAIWTACLLFFQGFLLLGYLYAHLLTKLNQLNKQVIVHTLLVVISFVMLPIGLNTTGNEITQNAPLQNIVMLLLGAIGIPYLILSSTGPLLQRWLTFEQTEKIPYKLYALSNTASLIALLSYPFIIEPMLTLKAQSNMWSVGYLAFAIALFSLCFKLFKQKIDINQVQVAAPTTQETDSKVESHNSFHPFLWLALSAVGVVLLVSTTNAMSQNISPVPFLWVMPLCLYLLTFIICFHHSRWYQRWYWFALFSLSAFSAILMIFIGTQFDIASQIGMYAFILFTACMICHGELSRLLPAAKNLTLFYLIISLGGFLGSVFVSIIAANYFTEFTEFPLAIIATFLLFVFSIKNDKTSDSHLPLLSKKLTFGAISIVLIGIVALYSQLTHLYNQHDVASERNFYGLLSVKDIEVNGQKERRLIDGTTSHGTQALDENLKRIPKSYYRENTGVAIALQYYAPFSAMKVGLIGLGAGTLAAYGRANDDYYFYELNPAVNDFANKYFSYIYDSRAYVEVAIGDGRLLLQEAYKKDGSLNFDVLVLDAFSGDSIPAHLLTKQAMQLYWQHLKLNGVLAIHISNSHLNLKPLIRGLAEQINIPAYYFKTPASDDDPNMAEWVLITKNESLLKKYAVKQLITPWPIDSESFVTWTDDYSNLLSVIK